MLDRITWLGHSGVLVEGSRNVYFDPYGLPGGLPKADVIFITHPHFDHCSPQDVAKVADERTLLVGPPDCARMFRREFLAMKPMESASARGIEVRALPARNARKPYHPEEKAWLGFCVSLDGARYYHAGDTDPTVEMAGLAPDVAFLPVDGLYNMTVESAINAVGAMRPGRALPVHFGTLCGGRGDAARFLAECERRGLPGEFFRRTRSAAEERRPPSLAEPRPVAA